MAIRIQIRNTTTNTTLASVDVPDAALPRLQAVFGDAQGALRFMVGKLRDHAVERQVSDARATGMAQIQADESSTRTAFGTDFPEVP